MLRQSPLGAAAGRPPSLSRCGLAAGRGRRGGLRPGPGGSLRGAHRRGLPGLHHAAPHSAHLALQAAHAAYESRFGHVFVICLDGFAPAEQPDQVLAGIRARLAHEPDQERVVTAEEMRRLARGRIIELVSGS